MIPSIRSVQELIEISKSRIRLNDLNQSCELNNLTEDSGQRKRYIRSEYDEKIKLPIFEKISRAQWKKSKKRMAKILEELDYNNQIQSSYEITLLGRVSKLDQRDVA